MKIPILFFIVCSLSLQSCQEKNESYVDKNKAEVLSKSDADLVKQGEYLVRSIGCDHCHTPKKMTDQGPVPDMDRWMMGYPQGDPLPEIPDNIGGPAGWLLMNNDLTAAVGPWGVSFGANLTPDDTGLGSWSFEQFKKAMTEGKYKGMDNSRPLMPPMPWQSYRDMKEEDLKAIFLYLQSIEPIENIVPSYRPPST